MLALLALLAGTAAAGAREITVGAMTLHSCGAEGTFCGTLERPIDPKGEVSGLIPIHFEYYPHLSPGAALGTLVATEGGPGYAATESRADYLALFEPLRGRRDVLLMDNRGTGQSGAIDCRAPPTAPQWTVEGIGACGRSLGERASLYSTAYAADDLAAILDALRVERIDLYGDSYGTYFEQVFAVRHPHRLRSIVLDGAYPLTGPDYAWYPNYAPAMRDKFNFACRRSPACAALPGNSIDHILPALNQMRADKDPAAGPSQLAIVMFGSAPALATVREVDAAARAWASGDRTPMLRLMKETNAGVDSSDPAANPKKWSAGLEAAVMCQDPPQIFDMRLAPDLRAAERDRALAARRESLPDTYAPFTIDEYRGMPLDYSFIDECVAWPVSPATHPASQVITPDAVYPDVPALVISGDLDNMTTVADGAAVAKAFKHGRQVVIANGLHVNALPRSRSDCGKTIVRRFIETLDSGDAGCAERVPPVRLVAQFARRAALLEPAVALPGNSASAEQLRVATAAVQTVGDVSVRARADSSGTLPGLRGGSFRAVTHGSNLHASLYQVHWTEDVAVAGAMERPLGRGGLVRARVTLTGPQGMTGQLRIEWPEDVADARARIEGSLGGATVSAEAPAP